MDDVGDQSRDLYLDRRNTGRQTRGRFEYQDACVALRCIQNLGPQGTVRAVVVEWTTDYVLIGDDGGKELVSVKHRDPGQHDWTFARLKAGHVFRDLHAVWRAMGEVGDYVFESNRGFEPALNAYVGNPGDARAPDEKAVRALADYLDIDLEEARRFIGHLYLRRDPLPDRQHIEAVAVQELAVVMQRLGLDPTRARTGFFAITARVAAVSTQRPLDPAQRVDRLVGFMSDVARRSAPSIADQLLTIDELRGLVAQVSCAVSATTGDVVDDPLFVGRERELLELAETLKPGSDQAVAPVVLHGLTGIGKTALAMRFAANHATALRTYVVPGDSATALIAGLHALDPAAPSRIPEAIGGPDAGQSLPNMPSLPDDPNLLILVDGVTDPAIATVLPRRSRTRIIITATARHVDDGFHHIALAGLTRAEAASYLRQVLPNADVEQLDALTDAFDGHPLGLVQGANYCRSEGLTTQAYLERLRRQPATMLDLGRAPVHPERVGPAIATAITSAIDRDACVWPLLAIISWLAPDAAPESLFDHTPLLLEPPPDHPWYRRPSTDQDLSEAYHQATTLADLFVRDRAVAALHKYSLVSREAAGLRMHPLVQTVARERMSAPQSAAWIEIALGLLLPYTVDSNTTDPSLSVLTAHVATVVEHAVTAKIDPLAVCAALSWLGSRHFYFGTLDAARRYHERAAALAQEMALPDCVIAGCLSELARDYRTAGDIDAALATVEVWLGHAQRSGDPHEYFQARLTGAQTLAYGQRFEEAAAALAGLSDSAPNYRLSVRDQIMRKSLIADIEHARGHLQDAKAAIDEAIALVDQVDDEGRRLDHLSALHAQAGRILRDLDEPADALAHQRTSLDAVRAFGAGVLLAQPLYGLATTLLNLEMADEAEQVIAEGMELAAMRGTDSPMYGGFVQALGRLALLRNDWAKAEELLTQALTLIERGGEPTRGDLAAAHFNLGTAYVAQQQFQQAADAYQHARDLDAATYGPNHGELITDEYRLAEARGAAGDMNAAYEAINRCLTIIRQGHPQGRRWRADVLSAAVVIDLELGQFLSG